MVADTREQAYVQAKPFSILQRAVAPDAGFPVGGFEPALLLLARRAAITGEAGAAGQGAESPG
jgi:hypothetical protein